MIADVGRGDTLVLKGLGFTSVEQVMAKVSGSPRGVEIHTSDSSSVMLLGVTFEDLGALNYTFA